MNQPVLLHIVERLEGFLGKLPDTIRKPILSELTPLKELFLQQRPPRFLFIGSSNLPLPQIMQALFSPGGEEQTSVDIMPVHRWADWNMHGHGTISVLDARDADDFAQAPIKEELADQPADIIFVLNHNDKGRGPHENDIEKLIAAVGWNDAAPLRAKIVGISTGAKSSVAQMEEALKAKPTIHDRLLKVVHLAEKESPEKHPLMSLLANELPNEAKIEMIRISRDSEAQHHVAQVLVKSTTAICTAIGTQPIPLADLPILTTLQLVMVSGIMYVSGRERSLRAATEFIGALGANVGAGMLLREGTRAILKFFPGWGNVVCGMVAGAGTYAIGRAATAFFLEGVSLKDARRTYLANRKSRARQALLPPKPAKAASVRKK